MSISEALGIIEDIIRGENEAAVDGNAYLDPPQVEALRVASVVLGDVLHDDLDKYRDKTEANPELVEAIESGELDPGIT